MNNQSPYAYGICSLDIDLSVILSCDFHMEYKLSFPLDYKEYLVEWLKKNYDNVGGWGFPIQKKYCQRPMTLEQFQADKEFAW